MNPTMYVFLVLAGTVAVCWIFKWILDKAVDMHMPKPASPTTDTSPYRSSTPPTETAKAVEDKKPPAAPLPVPVVDWSGGRNREARFRYVCPACATAWLYEPTVSPRLCACNSCETSHFHLGCGDDRTRGCGLRWIMRSALPKQPIITPPPGTTGTKEPS